MSGTPKRPRKVEVVPPPGDDVVSVPPPVTEVPPHDRFCDLVLTGGVASGVVYPWAIIEIARAYRFRNIGGTSVGAMAAALAAAAEYGRRVGFEQPFEVLRRSPASLARKLPDGRTRMLSLFQTNQRGKRLIRLWGKVFCGSRGSLDKARCEPADHMMRPLMLALGIYRVPLALGALVGLIVAKLVAWCLGECLLTITPLSVAWMVVLAILGAIAWFGHELWIDVREGAIKNFYGLCKGGTTENVDSPEGPTGICHWLNYGIQHSAGLTEDDLPLTFRDLWTAPMYPGAPRTCCGPRDPESSRAINLQVMTTNATHGRPYRLPLADQTSRLFFRPEEWEGFFPEEVLRALVDKARPYAPRDPAVDPTAHRVGGGFLELPDADLPVVVAARLSLSFPLLFSAVPLWAIDYEAPCLVRTLRRCMFTDGGASANFPIHLFDATVPCWPTFGLWLDKRTPYKVSDSPTKGQQELVWLPECLQEGWADSWDRFDPASNPGPESPALACPVARPRFGRHLEQLVGFLCGVADSAINWHDRTGLRLPHVRNRVARLLLLPDEGGLHIGMRREQILHMAHDYGTVAGQKFVQRFSGIGGRPSRAWNEQRWIRFNVMINGLRERLDGFGACAAWSTHSVPLRDAIDGAIREVMEMRDAAESTQRQDEDACAPEMARDRLVALEGLLRELEELEPGLRAAHPVFVADPQPELRLRAAL
jgi:predicted acylesterase/phospholipase RssA